MASNGTQTFENYVAGLSAGALQNNTLLPIVNATNTGYQANSITAYNLGSFFTQIFPPSTISNLAGTTWNAVSFGKPQFVNAQATVIPPTPRSGLRFQDEFIARELNFADYFDPSVSSDCTTALQNFLLYCQQVALTLKTTALDDQLMRISVRARIPRGYWQVSCPIVVPEYVNFCSDGLFVRLASTTTSGTDTYTGDTTSLACNNIYQPIMVVTGRAHVEKFDFYCNPTGQAAQQGSGVAIGKNWVMSGVINTASGSGYQPGDVLTLANPSKPPATGATVTVNTVDGAGGILTYTLTTGGVYFLPSVLQKKQWTTANGFSVFDGAGNFLTTGGNGSGATFSATWQSDFAGLVYSAGNTNVIVDTLIGHLRGAGIGGSFDGVTHGAQFGVQFSGLNHTADEIEIVGGNIGVNFVNASDVRCSILNPVQVKNTGLQFSASGSIECPNVVIDTPGQTGIIIANNSSAIILKGRIFSNLLFFNNPGTPGPIQVGSFGTGNINQGLDLDFTVDTSGTFFSNAINPALILKYCIQSSFNIKVVNGNRNNNPLLNHLINQMVEFGSGVDYKSISIRGSISYATGALFIDTSGNPLTPACHLDVWDGAVNGYARTYGTYAIYLTTDPTSGGSGTGVNKAGPGSTAYNTSAGRVFTNVGSAASPSWQMASIPTKSVQMPTTGFSIQMTTTKLLLNPAGTLATGTITFINNPVDGQICSICSTQQVTSLTLVAGTGGATILSPATFLAPGTPANYTYDAATNDWYPS